MKDKYNISFSGGRTSAYMTKMLIDNFSDQYEFIVTFANTGREHEKTLEFVNNCDNVFGFNTVWLEAVVHDDREGTTHKVVNFDTAARNGEPFEEVIKKYGLPNMSYPHCTRELKLQVLRSYLKNIGIDYKTVRTAIGIRYDEDRRAKESKDFNPQYPLISEWPTEKGQVLHWWKQQPFDLDIEEFEGNCLECFKKSNKKLFMQIRKSPDVFDWIRRVEKEHAFTNSLHGKRVFFRGNLDTDGLFKLHDLLGDYLFSQMDLFDVNESSCSTESCEVFS